MKFVISLAAIFWILAAISSANEIIPPDWGRPGPWRPGPIRQPIPWWQNCGEGSVPNPWLLSLCIPASALNADQPSAGTPSESSYVSPSSYSSSSEPSVTVQSSNNNASLNSSLENQPSPPPVAQPWAPVK